MIRSRHGRGRVRRLSFLLAGPVVLAALLGSARLAAQTLPSLRFLDLKVSVELSDGATTATKLVTIANDGPSSVPVTFRIIAPDAAVDVHIGTEPAERMLPPASVTSFTLTFAPTSTAEDVTGRLVAEASTDKSAPLTSPASVDFELLAARETTWWAQAVAICSLGLAALITLLRMWTIKPASSYVRSSRRVKLSAKMGPVNWKFGDSWASNLTAAGALLGTVSGASLLPERRLYVSEDWFTALNLFFGALVVVAPFVYASVRVANKPYPAGDKEPEYVGFVGTFLLCCAITLWAVLGEILTIGLFLMEAQSVFPAGALIAAGVVLAVIFVLAIWYAWNTMRWTVEAQVETASKKRRRKTRRGAEKLQEAGLSIQDVEDDEAGTGVAVDEQLLPSWSLM